MKRGNDVYPSSPWMPAEASEVDDASAASAQLPAESATILLIHSRLTGGVRALGQ